MKRISFVLLAACLLLIPGLESVAQYGDEPSPKLSVKIGVYSPFGTKFRASIKSLWKNMGLEYALKLDEFDRPLLVTSAMATSSSSDLVEASMAVVQLDERWYINKGEGSSFYYGAGLGWYSLKAKSRDLPFLPLESRSGAKLGVTAALGYQYRESSFGEVRLNYSGELANGLDFSGISVNIGMRLAF